jgi:flagellar motor switch protein FliM
MANVLSQDEIDALLQGLDGGEPEAPPPQPVKIREKPLEVEAQPYDFTRSEFSVHGQLPGLENVYNKFARRLRNIFASELGKAVYAGLDSLDAVVYEDLVKRLPLPSSIHLVRLEPLRGLGVFVISALLSYSMIDIFFGGTGMRMMKMEGREFTPIETNFLGKFVTKMLRGLEEAWGSVAEVTGRYLGSEMNPYLLGATAMADMMIMATYSIEMSSQVTGEIIFALPLASVEELRDRLKSPFPLTSEGTDSQEIRTRVRSHLSNTEVSLRAVVDATELSVRDVLRLRSGDFLELNPQSMERASLWLEGRPIFRGRAAQSNGSKVFVVSDRYGKQ